MRRLLTVLVPLLATACAYERVWGYPEYRSVRPSVSPLTQDAVGRLVRAGISDEIVIEKIRSDGLVSHPTSDQIVSLKKEGLSDRVIEAMVSARVPSSYEIAPPTVIYRDTVYTDPVWPYGPWWCWWLPHGNISWNWSYRH